MSRVDFYILGDDSEERRQTYLCRVADKANRLGHSVWIHVASEDAADALDKRLWTFTSESFVGHARATGDAADTTEPVLIGHSHTPDSERALLINDADDIPAGAERFERIAEIVNQAQATRQRGRGHYARYRDQGHELHHHPVD